MASNTSKFGNEELMLKYSISCTSQVDILSNLTVTYSFFPRTSLNELTVTVFLLLIFRFWIQAVHIKQTLLKFNLLKGFSLVLFKMQFGCFTHTMHREALGIVRSGVNSLWQPKSPGVEHSQCLGAQSEPQNLNVENNQTYALPCPPKAATASVIVRFIWYSWKSKHMSQALEDKGWKHWVSVQSKVLV